jgi:hypothetical protein
VLEAIRTDLLYEVGMNGQQVKNSKQMSVKIDTFYLCCQLDKSNANVMTTLNVPLCPRFHG